MREKSTGCAEEENDEILKHNRLWLQLVERGKEAELRCWWLALLHCVLVGKGDTKVGNAWLAFARLLS